jgi:mannosyltransferase
MTVRERLGLLVVMLAGFFLRIYRLDAQGFWTDEAWSHLIASLDMPGILEYSRQPYQHPPVYYYLLSVWMRLAGDSEFSMRFLSLFFSVLTVPLAYWFARRWFSSALARWSIILAAVSPFTVIYAQEARMYIVVLCVGMLALDFFLRWVEWQSRRAAAVFFSLTLLSFSIHYYAVLPFLVENLYLLFVAVRRYQSVQAANPARVSRPANGFSRHHAWLRAVALPWVLGDFLIVFALGAWIWFSSGPRTAVSQQIGRTLFEGRNLIELQRNLVFLVIGGIVYRPLSLTELAVTAFLLAVVGFGAVQLWRHARTNPRIALLYLLLIVPPIAASPVPLNYNARYFFITVPALIWLSAAAICWLPARNRLLSGAALVAILLANGYGIWFNYDFVKNAYREMARTVKESARPDDGIILDGPHQEYLAGYYLRGPWAQREIPTDADHAELSDLDPSLRTMQESHSRLWVVAQQASAVDPGDNVARWLSLNAYPVSRTWFQYDDFVALFLAGQPENPPVRRQIAFGDLLVLEQTGVSARGLRRLDGIAVHLTWKAQRRIGSNDRFLVSLHLYSESGQSMQEQISPPCAGYCPVDNWEPGEPVEDRHGLLVPPNLPDGTYSLRLGVYQPRQKQTLSVGVGQNIAGNELGLAQITVEGSEIIVR